MAKYGYKGWIKLWRASMNDPWYFSEPFTRWQAWTDLCMMADDNGTVLTSLEALKNRWLWGSKGKVARFLGTVNRTGRGTVESTPNKGTLIRINTGFYADGQKPKKKKNGTANGTENGIEELLLKEVGMAANEASQPQTIEKEEVADGEYGYE